MAKVKLKKVSQKGNKKMVETKVVSWKDNVKNPKNVLNVNDVRINRDTPLDAKTPSLFRKVFPKKVSQSEYNKFYEITPDSTVYKKKK
jgi:hypothetical protein